MKDIFSNAPAYAAIRKERENQTTHRDVIITGGKPVVTHRDVIIRLAK